MAGAGIYGGGVGESATGNPFDRLASGEPEGTLSIGVQLWNGITFAALQQLIPAPVPGTEAVITDSTVTAFAASISVGGGSNNVKARWNGANWTVCGA
jgi:hypothetical protein